MTISIQSLRALPPKQALILALSERARRNRLLQMQANAVAVATRTTRNRVQLDPRFFASETTSLCLDRTSVYWDLMHTPCRYKVYWGGRASAKSWAIAEALIRIAAAKPVRVLCTREFQVSIQNSSHKLLVDTI